MHLPLRACKPSTGSENEIPIELPEVQNVASLYSCEMSVADIFLPQAISDRESKHSSLSPGTAKQPGPRAFLRKVKKKFVGKTKCFKVLCLRTRTRTSDPDPPAEVYPTGGLLSALTDKSAIARTGSILYMEKWEPEIENKDDLYSIKAISKSLSDDRVGLNNADDEIIPTEDIQLVIAGTNLETNPNASAPIVEICQEASVDDYKELLAGNISIRINSLTDMQSHETQETNMNDYNAAITIESLKESLYRSLGSLFVGVRGEAMKDNAKDKVDEEENIPKATNVHRTQGRDKGAAESAFAKGHLRRISDSTFTYAYESEIDTLIDSEIDMKDELTLRSGDNSDILTIDTLEQTFDDDATKQSREGSTQTVLLPEGSEQDGVLTMDSLERILDVDSTKQSMGGSNTQMALGRQQKLIHAQTETIEREQEKIGEKRENQERSTIGPHEVNSRILPSFSKKSMARGTSNKKEQHGLVSKQDSRNDDDIVDRDFVNERHEDLWRIVDDTSGWHSVDSSKQHKRGVVRKIAKLATSRGGVSTISFPDAIRVKGFNNN